MCVCTYGCGCGCGCCHFKNLHPPISLYGCTKSLPCRSDKLKQQQPVSAAQHLISKMTRHGLQPLTTKLNPEVSLKGPKMCRLFFVLFGSYPSMRHLALCECLKKDLQAVKASSGPPSDRSARSGLNTPTARNFPANKRIVRITLKAGVMWQIIATSRRQL